MESTLQIPPDWERHPELVQALRVLVEGAVRACRGRPSRPVSVEVDGKDAGAFP